LKWWPDTCFCIIDCKRPSLNGEYIQRCRIHLTSRDTTECYAYNLLHRKKQIENDDQGDIRKRTVKEATRL